MDPLIRPAAEVAKQLTGFDVLLYGEIVRHTARWGYAPTIRELLAAVPLSSTSVVHYCLRRMVRLNALIHHGERKWRCYELPEGTPVEVTFQP